MPASTFIYSPSYTAIPAAVRPPSCCVRGSQLGRQKFPRLSNVGGARHLSQKLLILLAIVSEVIQGGAGRDTTAVLRGVLYLSKDWNRGSMREESALYPAYLYSIPHGTKWEFNTGIIHNGRTQYNISNSTIRQVS